MRTRWIFGFQRRRVFTCEWETLLPKLGPLLQISHVAAMAVLLIDLVIGTFVLDGQGARVARGGASAPIREL